MAPLVKKVFVFDCAGLVAVVLFRGRNYRVVTRWSEELSIRGAKFVAFVLKKKAEENVEFLEPRRDLIVRIGSRYIIALQHKLPRNHARKLLMKISEILSALRTFDPVEIGEVAAKTIIAELMG